MTSAIVFCATPLAYARGCDDTCEPLAYENHNQLEGEALSVSALKGKIVDTAGDPVPGVCLSLFTERGHHLVAATSSGKDGSFDFKAIPSGEYRVIAKYPYFCTANVRLRLVAGNGARRRRPSRMVVHMMPAGTDACGYGSYR
jgi:hypothetical protein